MKIAITEYENGGWNHIAGTIAQADNLGIFGSQGVFAANFWPPGGTYAYVLAGFRAFRGFDGANASFGDTSLQATSSNVKNVVVYASSDSTTPGRIVFVAINRSTSPDRKSTRLNSSHSQISYAVFCLKKKKQKPASHHHRHRSQVLRA